MSQFQALSPDLTLVVLGPHPDTEGPLNVVPMGAVTELSFRRVELRHVVGGAYELVLHRAALDPSGPGPHRLEAVFGEAEVHFGSVSGRLGVGVIARSRVDMRVVRALWFRPSAPLRFGDIITPSGYLDTLSCVGEFDAWPIVGKTLAELGVEEYGA